MCAYSVRIRAGIVAPEKLYTSVVVTGWCWWRRVSWLGSWVFSSTLPTTHAFLSVCAWVCGVYGWGMSSWHPLLHLPGFAGWVVLEGTEETKLATNGVDGCWFPRQRV
jgi:hypothetical protein